MLGTYLERYEGARSRVGRPLHRFEKWRALVQYGVEACYQLSVGRVVKRIAEKTSSEILRPLGCAIVGND